MLPNLHPRRENVHNTKSRSTDTRQKSQTTVRRAVSCDSQSSPGRQQRERQLGNYTGEPGSVALRPGSWQSVSFSSGGAKVTSAGGRSITSGLDICARRCSPLARPRLMARIAHEYMNRSARGRDDERAWCSASRLGAFVSRLPDANVVGDANDEMRRECCRCICASVVDEYGIL